MSGRAQAQAARRLKAATVRVENDPYNFVSPRRTPRLGGGAAILWCVPSATIAAGTYPPGGAPGGPLTGQTIYSISGGAYVALQGTHDVYNPHAAAYGTAGKLAAVTGNADGTYSLVDWDC